MSESNHQFEYEVALSFAGEDRSYVARVAAALRSAGVKVFYDEYETVTLWGKDLYAHLRDVYQNRARYTVLFASTHYATKVWTSHERESAQARAIAERTEYILPARFDDSTIPGLLPTTGYIDLRSVPPEQLADLILAKLGHRPGSWEAQPAVALPGEATPREESLRERAARLSVQHRSREARARLLQSEAGVTLARDEVRWMFDYIAEEVQALRNADPSLSLSHVVSNQGVLLVRSPRSSFTMHWGQEYGNTLEGARLFTREFNGPHSLDGFGARRQAERETYLRFEVDESTRARWRDDDTPSILLTTQQMADRYLSHESPRVFRRARYVSAGSET